MLETFEEISTDLGICPWLKRTLKDGIEHDLGFLYQKGLIKGAGHSIRNWVYTTVYFGLWKLYMIFGNRLMATVMLEEACAHEFEDPLTRLARDPQKFMEEIEAKGREALDITPFVEGLEIYRVIERFRKHYPEKVLRTMKDQLFRFRKLKLNYVFLGKVDSTFSRLEDPKFYRLFENPFKGMPRRKLVPAINSEGKTGLLQIMKYDKRKRRLDTLKSYVDEIKIRGYLRAHDFLTRVPSKRKNGRRGLLCACTYIEAWLKVLDDFDFFSGRLGASPEYVRKITFKPKAKNRWAKFFKMNRNTFNTRLDQLYEVYPIAKDHLEFAQELVRKKNLVQDI